MRFYPRYTNSVPQVTLLAALGDWTNPYIVGTARFWHDSITDVLRVKYGSNPSSETDGSELVEGV